MNVVRTTLTLAFLILFGSSESGWARSAFGVHGGKGDAEVADECPAGSYFTGIVGNTGAWIDQITVICGKAPGDGSVSGGKSLPLRGGGGGAFKSVLCGKNEIIDAIDAQRTAWHRAATMPTRRESSWQQERRT